MSSPWGMHLLEALAIAPGIAIGTLKGEIDAGVSWFLWILILVVVGLLARVFFTAVTGKPRLIISRGGVERQGFFNRSSCFEWHEVDGNFVDAWAASDVPSQVAFNLPPDHPRKRKKLLSDTYDVYLGGDYKMANQEIVKLLNERLSLWRASRPA